MRVLNLVATKRSFFNTQVDILEQKGIEQTTITVPGEYRPQEGKERSVADYLRFYPDVLEQSFNSYDVIHANNGLVAPHAIAQPKLPTVVSFWGRDVYSDLYLQSKVSKLCAKLAGEVIVMSEQMAEKLAVDVHVIPHGVDMSTFRPMDQSDAQEQVGWDSDVKHVLFPYAPSRPEKNVAVAHSVVDTVNTNVAPTVKLHTVYGVPHDEVPIYMNAADALLLTSKYEGSPNAVKEALACNLPVIATDVGDVSDRLEGVKLSETGETKRELVSALEITISAGERSNGREEIKNVNVEQMGDAILDVYKKATDRGE